MDDVLPDMLQEKLKVVFCGTAASEKSARLKAYYAGPGNRFWPTLFEIGLTPNPLQPHEFQQVIHYGIGLTDIAKQASGVDAALIQSDFDAALFKEKIHHFQPRIVAFTSKRAAREGLMLSSAALAYGWLDQTIGQTRLYVLPSPSGAARAYWNIAFWQALADEIKRFDG